MITINNKSRYFSASEDMFPTMERNFAWLFGMQTPEQGWKAAMAKAIYRSARASSAEEWQYGFPIGSSAGRCRRNWMTASRCSSRMTSWPT